MYLRIRLFLPKYFCVLLSKSRTCCSFRGEKMPFYVIDEITNGYEGKIRVFMGIRDGISLNSSSPDLI